MLQTVPPKMRAAIVESFNSPYKIKDIPTPAQPQDHDILIKVLAASYCHTDAVFCSGAMSREIPRIGCHEFAGQVVSLGPLVASRLQLAVGTKVGVPGRAYHPCSTCFECTSKDGDPDGYSPYCPNAKNLGLTTDGGFQEYCLVDSRQVAPIPSKLTAVETAPLMCAGLTIWAALQREEIKNAKSVAIMGAAGGLGHLGVQFAAKLGKQVLAIDAGKKGMEFLVTVVAELGDHSGNVTIADVQNTEADVAIRSLRKGKLEGSIEEHGVDAVIVLPEAQGAMDYGLKLLKNHGTAVIVSFPTRGFQVSARDLVFRDIKLVGSLVGRNFQLREMLEFAAEHKVKATLRTFPLQKLNELVEEYHKGGGGKFVVDMSLN